MKRNQKITLEEMRSRGGPTRLLVYCSDHRRSHSVVVDAAFHGVITLSNGEDTDHNPQIPDPAPSSMAAP